MGSINNVNLWFSKDINNNIVLIGNINEQNKHNEYFCPICNSKVVPRTGSKMSWHFAHKDSKKCGSEAMIHWWIKNELVKEGDVFNVIIDGQVINYKCKEILIEKSQVTILGVYKPDITIITDTDEQIYVEIANTNKKRIKDYADMWEELNNIVVEVDVKDIITGDKINIFNNIDYKRYIYNRDVDKTIKKICRKNKVEYKDYIENLQWVMNDCYKYINGEVEIDELYDEIELLDDRNIILDILSNNDKCNSIYKNLKDYECDKFYKHYGIKIKDKVNNSYIDLLDRKLKIRSKLIDNCSMGLKIDDNSYEKSYTEYNMINRYKQEGYHINIYIDNDKNNSLYKFDLTYDNEINVDNIIKIMKSYIEERKKEEKIKSENKEDVKIKIYELKKYIKLLNNNLGYENDLRITILDNKNIEYYGGDFDYLLSRNSYFRSVSMKNFETYFNNNEYNFIIKLSIKFKFYYESCSFEECSPYIIYIDTEEYMNSDNRYYYLKNILVKEIDKNKNKYDLLNKIFDLHKNMLQRFILNYDNLYDFRYRGVKIVNFSEDNIRFTIGKTNIFVDMYTDKITVCYNENIDTFNDINDSEFIFDKISTLFSDCIRKQIYKKPIDIK